MTVGKPSGNLVRRPPRRLVLGGIILVILLILAFTVDLRHVLQNTLDWVRNLGPLGVFAYSLIYITTVLLLVPATFLTLGAGATFGVAVGFPLVWFSATAGATGAFLLGRSLARVWVEEHLTSHPRVAALDRAVGQSGWKIVLLSRMCPFFPFTLINYAFGASPISLTRYVLATAAGLAPGILLYVWIGDTLGDLAGLQGGEAAVMGPWRWIFYTAGLLVGLGVTVYVARLAQRALTQAVESPENTPSPHSPAS